MAIKTEQVTASTELKDKEGKVLSKPEVTCEMEVGDSLEDLTAVYGEDPVRDYALRGLKVAFQGTQRDHLKGGVDPEDIPGEMVGWRPNQGAGIKDPVVASRAQWKRMSPEQQKAFLAEVT